VFVAEFAGGIVAIFLESMELAREPTENVNGGRKFFGVGSELFADVCFEEELGELCGCELKADFGELGGVGGAEMFDEVILEEASFQSAVLLVAPFAIAAARLPIRNVARGGRDTVFGESVGDFGMGNVVAQHAVNHVADGMRKPSDFAVATDFAGGGWWMVVS